MAVSNFAMMSSGVNSLGGAVSDFFSAAGAAKSVGLYKGAADQAAENVRTSAESTLLTDIAAQRKIEKTLGAQQAQVAHAGFAESGSALDLLSESVTQGALNRAVIGVQGQIEQGQFKAQEQAAETEAAAARGAATGAMIGGVVKGITGVATLAAL